MADYAALKAELLKADLAGLTDAAAATKLNTDTVQTQTNRDIVPAYEVFEAIVPAEWTAVTAANQSRVNTLLAMGSVNAAGTNTKATFSAAFVAGTQTRTNLLALTTVTTTTSRAVALAGWGQPVSVGDVDRARRLT